jgi:hypothetical protein
VGRLALGGTPDGQLPQVVLQHGTLATAVVSDHASVVGSTLNTGSVSGGGDIYLTQGSTATVQGPVDPGVYFNFIGPNSEVVTADPSAFNGQITNFSTNDVVLFQNTVYDPSDQLTTPGVGVYQVAGPTGGQSVNLLVAPGTHPQLGNVDGQLAIVACFVPGTRLRSERGDIAVEELVEGDRMVTFEPDAVALGSPRTQPVCWIGRRQLDPVRHPQPLSILPIRIRRDAFAPGVPSRDLLVSPDHGIFAEGVLIPARYLVNGRTITRESSRRPITYYHVEVPRHAILLAEGLPAESYLDNGDRSLFEPGGRMVEQFPDLSTRRWEADACAPIMVCGGELEAVRRRLLDRAAGLALAPAA